MSRYFAIKSANKKWFTEGQLVAELVVSLSAVIAVTSILLILFGFIGKVVRFDATSADIARTASFSTGSISSTAKQRLNQDLCIKAMQFAWCAVDVEEKIISEIPAPTYEISFRLEYGPIRSVIQVYKYKITFPVLTRIRRFQIVRPN